MKNTIERGTRKGFILQQFIKGASGALRLRGKHYNASTPSPGIPERNGSVSAILAVLSLSLLLVSLIGTIGAITSTHALAPNQPFANSLAAKPTKTPPGRHSPTPTLVSSPTSTATPSSTFTATPTTIATVKATPLATRKPGGSQMSTPASTLATSTGAVQHPSQDQQKSGIALFPIVIGTLSGIGGVVLLGAVGLLLRRKWRMPLGKVKLPASGAATWQRVRTTSQHGNMHTPGYSVQRLPTTDGFLPTARNIIPSRRGFSSTTSNVAPKGQSMPPTEHFLKPTRLRAMHNSGMPVAPKRNNSIPTRQNSQQIAAMSESSKDRNSEVMPWLDDPF
jgi:hypothetical protein